MVVDTSAIVAIHLKEPGFDRLIDKIDRADVVAVGAATMLETAMVLASRLRMDPRAMLAGSLRRMEAQIIPFTQEHFDVATEAFLRFGRGRHPAELNFGDCMAYATAALAALPLLYTGSDFAQTDIPSA